jgi:hypothetical protein
MKIIPTYIVSALLFLLLSSCYSFKIYPKEDRNFVYTGEKKEAFILNPELKKEYRVLAKSGIYNIVSDSNKTGVIKVRLYHIRQDFVCGEPILANWITLGQWPVYLPDRYQFKYDEIQGSVVQHKQFDLRVATRYWFWDLFTFEKNFGKKAGQSLLAEYYREETR